MGDAQSSRSVREEPESIDISGLPKALLLKALHDGTRPQGYGFLHARTDDVPVEEFQRRIDEGISHDTVPRRRPEQLYFDYVLGRPIKADISGDSFDPWGYDRDAGDGTAARVVAALRLRLAS